MVNAAILPGVLICPHRHGIAPRPFAERNDRMLTVRGISYLVGEIPVDIVRRDLTAIRDDLHCTAVMSIGADVDQLIAVAGQALDLGLDVYIRPNATELRPPELLAHLTRTAASAEQLRIRYPGKVTLLVGSEFSHTARGIVPGFRSYLRLRLILRARTLLRHRIDRRLDALLAKAAETARDVFHGPVTYAAAGWESVDWSRFDLVGVSLYRSGTDHTSYERRVRALVGESAKPVVITEFGCGAFTGADVRGPGSFQIVNWYARPPRIMDAHPRDENTQARYLTELIDLYDQTGVHGAFVFTFSMPDFAHHDDPALDLDRAGFGIVTVTADHPAQWRPKAAFRAVAHRYGGR
ncbi:hypothetical protein P3102_21765 [Amycolatopsis sp. QT-25]|uniref:hypothetical protein n=1 Tax=Amycolatopsis sp. QT-25 TaxID=3034022 RepID=UPI0023ECF5B0|nr:hypothetical protein [Amycolatopsis sp. QT-25]WET76738.1 hypothetical protein P3102_21765 [Amycolatopsis sp. QT-25]